MAAVHELALITYVQCIGKTSRELTRGRNNRKKCTRGLHFSHIYFFRGCIGRGVYTGEVEQKTNEFGTDGVEKKNKTLGNNTRTRQDNQ